MFISNCTLCVSKGNGIKFVMGDMVEAAVARGSCDMGVLHICMHQLHVLHDCIS